MVLIFDEVHAIDPEHITPDYVSNVIKRKSPHIWNLLYTKVIEAPPNYDGFKLPAVALATSIISRAGNTASAAGILQQYDYPTYYVSKNLFAALRHTHPPSEMLDEQGNKREFLWSDIFFPFPGMIFMIPRNTLIEQPSGKAINFIGIARLPAGEAIQVPGTTERVKTLPGEDRIVIFWAVDAGLVVQDCLFPVTQKLEPSSEWIDEKTKVHHAGEYREDIPSGQFSARVAGIVANLVLVMSARPEIVEGGERTGEIVKQNKKHSPKKHSLAFYRPTFIGRKYEIHRKDGPKVETGAYFTELRWRSGYMRLQHHGPQNKLHKVVMIDPYICFGAGLVQPE